MPDKTKWVHSVPAWALGPRAASAKFGGNIITNGWDSVKYRLTQVVALSGKMGLSGESALRSSGHILHEVKTGIVEYAQHNAPGAIDFDELVAGIESGRYPQWVAMTAPQFGFIGAERGGMISRYGEDREMARLLHIEAITRSRTLCEMGLGAGINIWWPAWTSRKFDDPRNPPMELGDAWHIMVDFWVNVLKETGGTMWLEWKPGDPGVDYLMTLDLAVEFCETINNALGRKGMFINNEFAHILLSGVDVAYGVQRTVQAGLFHQFVHANSGWKLPVTIQGLLDRHMLVEEIPILIDADWPVGAGGEFNWYDQQAAIDVMDKAGQDIIYCEHDVNPAGQPPLEVFELSIRNAQTMLQKVRGEG
jgi:hypothetical protein